MSEIENLKDAMKRIQEGDAWHGPALRDTLMDVSTQEASARPIPGSHTIWELVLHIAAWQEAFLRRLQGYKTEEPVEGDFPPVSANDDEGWKKAVERLETSHRKLLEYYSVLQNSSLEEKVVGKNFSVAYMLHGIIRHHVYHAGQIGLLKRLLRVKRG
jgi:uncharacterized damage-inducible protein DinB